MELLNKNLGTPFDQLGLDSDAVSIDTFISSHVTLQNDMKISEAPFWAEAQAALLEGDLDEDAEWAPVVDDLNVRLHEVPASVKHV